jgi:hypothetical protein
MKENEENIPANNGSVSVTPSVPANVPSRQNESRPAGGDADAKLELSIKEIKKLNEEISAARQENIQLKVEVLQLKRQAENGLTDPDTASEQPTEGDRYTVHTQNPDNYALSTIHLYLALLIVTIGIIMGKFVF